MISVFSAAFCEGQIRQLDFIENSILKADERTENINKKRYNTWTRDNYAKLFVSFRRTGEIKRDFSNGTVSLTPHRGVLLVSDKGNGVLL